MKRPRASSLGTLVALAATVGLLAFPAQASSPAPDAPAAVPTAAGLYLLEATEGTFEVDFERRTVAPEAGPATSTTHLSAARSFARRATPSLSWRTTVYGNRGGDAFSLSLMPEASYKILDRVVLGLGAGVERHSSHYYGRMAPAFAVKGETYAVGYGADFRRGYGGLAREQLLHGSYTVDAQSALALIYRLKPLGQAEEHAVDLIMSRATGAFTFDTALGYRVAAKPLPDRAALGVTLHWRLHPVWRPVFEAGYEFGRNADVAVRQSRAGLGITHVL